MSSTNDKEIGIDSETSSERSDSPRSSGHSQMDKLERIDSIATNSPASESPEADLGNMSLESLQCEIIRSEKEYLRFLDVMKQITQLLEHTQKTLPKGHLNQLFAEIKQIMEIHSDFKNKMTNSEPTHFGEIYKDKLKLFDVYEKCCRTMAKLVSTLDGAEDKEIMKDIKFTESIKNANYQHGFKMIESRIETEISFISILKQILKEDKSEFSQLQEALEMAKYYSSTIEGVNSYQNLLYVNYVNFSTSKPKLALFWIFDEFICLTNLLEMTNSPSLKDIDIIWSFPITKIHLKENSEKYKRRNLLGRTKSMTNYININSMLIKYNSEIRNSSTKYSDVTKRKIIQKIEGLFFLESNILITICVNKTKEYKIFVTSDTEQKIIDNCIKQAHSQTKSIPSKKLKIEDTKKIILTNLKYKFPLNDTIESIFSGHSGITGMIQVHIETLSGSKTKSDFQCHVEIATFGFFTEVAVTRKITDTLLPRWNETFSIECLTCNCLKIICTQSFEGTENVIGNAVIRLDEYCIHLHKKTEMEFEIGPEKLKLSLSIMLEYHSINNSVIFTDQKNFRNSKTNFYLDFDLKSICRLEKTSIPRLITLCIEHVNKKGLEHVGVYRLNGIETSIKKLYNQFNFETSIKELSEIMDNESIDTVTSLLKIFLKSLPECLLTSNLYNQFINVTSIEDLDQRMETLLDLYNCLPPFNKSTLFCLLEHIKKILDFEEVNKIDVNNISLLFGSVILFPDTPETDLQKSINVCFAQAEVVSNLISLFDKFKKEM